MFNAQDSIQVDLWCGNGKVVPKIFVWKNREYQVKRITMDLDRKDGGKKYRCFVVETGGMMAELVWDLQNWGWSIWKVQSCI